MAAATRRCWVLTAFISGAIVAFVGCGHSGKPAATSATTTPPHGSWSRPAAPPDPHTLLRAGAAAVAAVPNGTLIFVRSQESGTWRVLVATPDGTTQSMDVSSDGVTVMVGPTPKNESDADKTQNRARVQAARVDYRAAVDKILATVRDASVTELNLGDSNGTPVWEADVWDYYIVEHKVTINAASGDLIANKQV
ncbi:MAG TPA: metallopeptidase [Mycobacterium sp.]|nr:metallopeptidase [Mycobacterium sp.]